MDVLNITKITLAWELLEAGMPKSHIASRLGLQRETVHLWIKGILEHDLVGFLDRYHYHRPYISLGMRPPLERSLCRIFTETYRT